MIIPFHQEVISGIYKNLKIKIADLITVSKGLSPPVLAQGWINDLGARPDISIKVDFLSHDMRIAGRIVGVQSTEQSV